MRIHSLRAKLLFSLFCLLFRPIWIVDFFFHLCGQGMMKKSTMDHLQNLVEVKETAIEQWLKEERIGREDNNGEPGGQITGEKTD